MYVLSIDQGTTSTRAIIFNQTGKSVGVAQQELTQHYPAPGWVNHNAVEIWNATVAVCEKVLSNAGLNAWDIGAVAIANQRETTVVWDRDTGQPLAPAIVWQSRQSTPIVDDIVNRGMAGTYQAKTGLQPDAYFSATKLAMLLRDDSDLRNRAESGSAVFGTIDSWLIWNLTGGAVHATDTTNASRTMLFDIHELNWSEELLSDLGIPPTMLPEVRPSSGMFGTVSTIDGLEGTPILGVAGDQHAALFGQSCFTPGDVKCTYGTGAFMVMNTGVDAIPSATGLLTTVAWQLGDVVTYALEGAVFISGAAVQWLRDGLGILERSADIEALAASVPSSDGVVFVPAFVGLGAPHWDSSARGSIFGLTRGSTSAHVARATLEAIALQVADVVKAMNTDSGIDISALKIDGGAAGNDLLAQIQSDVLGIDVVRPAELETTALGAAFLAGLASGLWSSTDEISTIWAEERRFMSTMTQPVRNALRQRWQQGVENSRGWA
ncbi:glycerol kinase GlpK [soil metagenome]